MKKTLMIPIIFICLTSASNRTPIVMQKNIPPVKEKYQPWKKVEKLDSLMRKLL